MTGYRAPFRPRPGDSPALVRFKIAALVLVIGIAAATYLLVLAIANGGLK